MSRLPAVLPVHRRSPVLTAVHRRSLPPSARPSGYYSTYTPPRPPSPSSRPLVPSHASTSHPMPSSMPREDYVQPLRYTSTLLFNVIRYGVYAIVGGAIVVAVALEGGHQYVEWVAMPRRRGRRTTSNDHDDKDAWYGWDQDPGWTGTRSGTDSRLGWYARHLVRSAWVAQELGGGGIGRTIGSHSDVLQGQERSYAKDMITTTSSSSSSSNRPPASTSTPTSTVNRTDPGYSLSLSYLTATITYLSTHSLATFPPPLSVTHPLTPPRPSSSSTTAAAAAVPRTMDDAERIGLVLTLREADVAEKIGTQAALTRARDALERVVWFLVDSNVDRRDSTAATPATPATAVTATTTSTTHPAEPLRLATKIATISSRLGDDDRATEWFKWGLETGVDLARVSVGTSSTVESSSAVGGAAAAAASAAREVGRQLVRIGQGDKVAVADERGQDGKRWFGLSRWFSSDATSPTTSSTATAAAPTTTDPAATLLLSSVDLNTIPPPTFRALISHISSFSAFLATRGRLDRAEWLQRIGLGLLDASSSSSSDAEPSRIDVTPSARLQSLWNLHRKSLFTLHIAEIRYARSKEDRPALVALTRAVSQSERTIESLTASSPSSSSPSSSTRDVTMTMTMTTPQLPSEPDVMMTAALVNPNEAPPVQARGVSPSFGSPRTALRDAADELLRDARRTAGQGWFLSGAVLERSAKKVEDDDAADDRRRKDKRLVKANIPPPANELRLLALDCYDRALQWYRVALGGQPNEDEDSLPRSAYDDPASGGERAVYWGAAARLRERLQRGVDG